MKKYIFLFLLTVSVSYAQKKTVASKNASALAKADNVSLVYKNNSLQLVSTEKGKSPITIKSLTAAPENCKIVSYKPNGAQLYVVSWDEKTNTKTATKTENIVTTNSKIYEMSSQKEVFSNSKLVNNITEKVFLDKNKTASETQDKIRREGFDLVVNADGTLSQKGKNQENKFSYDAASMSFVDAKKKK